jgi:hypothetical protein
MSALPPGTPPDIPQRVDRSTTDPERGRHGSTGGLPTQEGKALAADAVASTASEKLPLSTDPRIAALPVDDRVGLPIPWSSPTLATGRPDFTRADGTKAIEASNRRLCGVCGQPLEYWVAFLGTLAAARNRVFHDPPMHESCAREAVRLCPHIARGSAVAQIGAAGRTTPAGWAILITRSWQLVVVDAVVTFFPAPAKRVAVYTYDTNRQLVHTADQL